jgi:hypothetical protein
MMERENIKGTKDEESAGDNLRTRIDDKVKYERISNRLLILSRIQKK